ncbi:hypothetical protein NC653_033346 [Populus alba x Populus x berolinensis]|uniref:Uncharacterized protein n=1 Tax=Populus alba x Populus x berolinensis TaxID=444605 RepID=A0AAD6Q0S0_9ROSI|nr:hypothetical protein NC653_033346 [Populus alba x Populus x berolinensis]
MKLCFKSEGDTEATGNFLQQALLNSPPAIGILNSLQELFLIVFSPFMFGGWNLTRSLRHPEKQMLHCDRTSGF